MAAIHEAMCKIMAAVDPIAKGQRNTEQGFMFRGIDDIYNELHGIMAQNQVFSLANIVSDQVDEVESKAGKKGFHRLLTIKYTFYHADGSSVDSVVEGEAIDYGDKSASKCMAIAHKYCLLQAFAIPTADMPDPDKDGHDIKATRKQEDFGKFAKAKGPEHVTGYDGECLTSGENAIPYSYVQAKWKSLLNWDDEVGKVDLAKWAEAHGITVRSWKPIMPSLQKQYLAHLNDLYDQLKTDAKAERQFEEERDKHLSQLKTDSASVKGD